MNDDDRHIPVRLCMGGKPRFAEGGLAHAAQAVNSAGRFGDDMVIHINRREFEELRQKWGEPHINPETGLPEFWDLKDLWNDVKDYVAPVAGVAAGALLPGLGSALGSALPGVGSLLGATGTQALASGLLGAGIGALTNGGTGALLGGLGGIGGAYGGDLLRNGTSSALGSALSGGGAGLTDMLSGGDSLMGASADNALGLGGGSKNALLPALLMAGLNLGGSAMSGSGDKQQKLAKGQYNDANDQFNKPLPVYENKRRRNYYTDVPDYTAQGEREYFSNNGFADGGAVKDQSRVGWVMGEQKKSPLQILAELIRREREAPTVADGKSDLETSFGHCQYAEGGAVGYDHGNDVDHGRSDKIDALLSPGEYVIDAETVALLGNGSTEAGAAALDGLRQNIRKHKGSALAAGAISPDALPPEQYI